MIAVVAQTNLAARHGVTISYSNPIKVYSFEDVKKFNFAKSPFGVHYPVVDAPMSPLGDLKNRVIYFFLIYPYGIDEFKADLTGFKPGDILYPYGNPLRPKLNYVFGAAETGENTKVIWGRSLPLHLGKNKNPPQPQDPYVNAFIPNIYKITTGRLSGGLLGFVHLENDFQDAGYTRTAYSIGLAFSADTGKTWTYLGYSDAAHDGAIIQPNLLWSTRLGNSAPYNIGGVPYLVYPDAPTSTKWLYVYFNEWAAVPPNKEKFGNVNVAGNNTPASQKVCVARAKFDEVISEVVRLYPFNKAGNRATWKSGLWHKWKGNDPEEPDLRDVSPDWTANALAGGGAENAGVNVVPHVPNVDLYDSHADAAACSDAGLYMLVVNTSGYGKLLLYTSTNGLNWDKSTVTTSGNPVIFDNRLNCSDFTCESEPALKSACMHMEHPFFVSVDDSTKGVTDDGNDVGRKFYIIWPRQVCFNPVTDSHFSQELYECYIRLDGAVTHAPNRAGGGNIKKR